MSDANPPAVSSTPAISAANITGSPASTLAALAVLAQPVADVVTHFQLPTTVQGWITVALALLATLARA